MTGKSNIISKGYESSNSSTSSTDYKKKKPSFGYDAAKGGYTDQNGRFYPTNNPNFVPNSSVGLDGGKTYDTSVRINPDNIVSGGPGGQVAIRGNASNNVQYLAKSEEKKTEELPNTPFNPQTTQVGVSSGVAGKINAQSLREDAIYNASVQQTERNPRPQSIDKNAGSNIPKRRTFGERLRAGYRASPLFPLVEGTKYAFGAGEYAQTSKGIFEQGRVAEQEANLAVAKEGFANALIVGGISMNAKPAPTASNRPVDVKVNLAVKQTATQNAVNSQAKILPGSELVVQKKVLGLFPKNQKFVVKGTLVESAKNTGVAGLKSNEPIFSTVGSGKLLLQGKKGKPFIVDLSSTGSEVAGFGNRRSVLTLSRAGRQRGSERFVDFYAGNKVTGAGGDEVFYAGLVNKKGSGFVVGTKAAEVSGTKPSVFRNVVHDPVLGIERLGGKAGQRVTYSDFSKVKPANSVEVLGVDFTKQTGGSGVYYRHGDTIKLGKTQSRFVLEGAPKVKTYTHELGHSFQAKTNVVNPFDKGVSKEVKLELFGNNRGPAIKRYYTDRGYAGKEVPNEFYADLFSSYVENPQQFARAYPKTAEFMGKQIGRFESGTLKQAVIEIPGKSESVKLFYAKSASQSAIPESALLTKSMIRERLLAEKAVFSLDNVRPGVVSSVAREQASGGVSVQVQQPQSSTGVFNVQETLIKSGNLAVFTSPKVSAGQVAVLGLSSSSSRQNPGQLTNPISVSKNTTTTAPKLNIVSYSGEKSSSKPALVSGLSFGNIGKTRPNTDSLFRAEPTTSLQNKLVTNTVVEQKPMQDTLTQTKQSSQTRTSLFRTPGLTSPSLVVPLVAPSLFKSGNQGSFSVFARRKGKFQLIGKTSSLTKAFSIGKSFVGNTSSATFKIMGRGGLVTGNAGGDFYSKGGLFIERRGKRIKSSGELNEITFKGIKSKMKRRSII